MKKVTKIGLMVLLAFVITGKGWLTQVTAQSGGILTENAQPVSLKVGEISERELKIGDTHSYTFYFETNDLVRFNLEQKGIEIILRLVGKDGKVIHEVDTPNGVLDPETLSAIIHQSGPYRLDVTTRKFTAAQGKYVLKLAARRPATEEDRHLVELEQSNSEVVRLWRAGDLDQGLSVSLKEVEQAEQWLGPDHIVLAKSLNNLALLYEDKNNLAKAEVWFQRSLAIREKVLGPNHADVAQSLSNLADIYQIKGNHAQAELLLLRTLAIAEKALGPEHPVMAGYLNSLGLNVESQGDFSRAEALYQRSLAIYEKFYGSRHPEIARLINNLGHLFSSKGDLASSELYYQRALNMWEEIYGPDHLDVAKCLNNLAAVNRVKGDFNKSESLFLRSLAIFEKALGANTTTIAIIRSNLGLFYKETRDFVKAEAMYQSALAIYEKAVGTDNQTYASMLVNLASLYKSKGDYVLMEQFYQRSLVIMEKTSGPDHPLLANQLINMSEVYRYKKDFAQAEQLIKRGVAILEKKFGTNHQDVAWALSFLGNLSLAKGDLTQAVQYFQQTLIIREKTLGPVHREVGSNLINLGSVYLILGDYTKAEPLILRGLSIREQSFGENNYYVAETCGLLAQLYWAKGETAKATPYLIRCNDLIERDLSRNLVAGSEHQKTLFINQTNGKTDQTISYHVQAASHEPAALEAALTVILRRKGRALDAMTNALAIVRNHQSAETKKLFEDYTALNGQISDMSLKGPGKKKPDTYRNELKVLEDKKTRLENEISRQSGEFKAQTTSITLPAVLHHLPGDAALVEYAVYHPFDPHTGKYGKPRYVVYVAKPDPETKSGSNQSLGEKSTETESNHQANNQNKNSLQESDNRLRPPASLFWVDLGETEPIDQAVKAFRKVLGNPKSQISQEVKPLAQALDRMVMKPVRAFVGARPHLFLSPDGLLNLIPFAALVDEQGKFLVETRTLTYVTSGRDLLRLQVKTPPRQPAIILANPDYSTGPGPILSGQSYKPLGMLVNSELEGSVIQKLLGNAQLVVRNAATEGVVKKAQGPEILHIATHGYFLDDAANAPISEETRGVIRPLENPNVEEFRVKNPLLRSWLFFSGANHGGDEANDGIMTALEAAQLDLWGTRLVVLSACETGLGETRNGEGVYGLRRALVLAGSESQLMSLWSVSDQGTRELMTQYYSRLKKGEARSEALSHTQRKLLQNQGRRHPYYWASFIQSGAWENLENKKPQAPGTPTKYP